MSSLSHPHKRGYRCLRHRTISSRTCYRTLTNRGYHATRRVVAPSHIVRIIRAFHSPTKLSHPRMEGIGTSLYCPTNFRTLDRGYPWNSVPLGLLSHPRNGGYLYYSLEEPLLSYPQGGYPRYLSREQAWGSVIAPSHRGYLARDLRQFLHEHVIAPSHWRVSVPWSCTDMTDLGLSHPLLRVIPRLVRVG
jgi:hypothetical protein